ncbi:hypothetical protein P3G55_18025, partial [Leptospira sp. 96542]|nr:hypothetical protein [Leptospira sp. 96542]
MKIVLIVVTYLWILFVPTSQWGWQNKGRKIVRFSGTLLAWEADSPNPSFQFEDKASGKRRIVHCDKETMSSLHPNLDGSTSIDGKMSQLSPTSDVWLCVGKPHIFQRFSVGPNRNLGIGTKQVKG